MSVRVLVRVEPRPLQVIVTLGGLACLIGAVALARCVLRRLQ